MLTIGQLARVAGVTVKTVRHYHARGLLPEPGRDASGYRRYDADAAVTLIRIRTLAGAGVPLARVQDLLAADPEEFARAAARIDAELVERIRRLEAHRATVAQLTGADGLALPPDVVGYLGELRAVGVSERAVRLERDGWILLAAHAPEQVARWIRDKRHALADPRFRAIYLRMDEALTWEPTDPRLAQLADALVELAARARAEGEPWAVSESTAIDADIAALVNQQTMSASPSWDRIARLVDERVRTATRRARPGTR